MERNINFPRFVILLFETTGSETFDDRHTELIHSSDEIDEIHQAPQRTKTIRATLPLRNNVCIGAVGSLK